MVDDFNDDLSIGNLSSPNKLEDITPSHKVEGTVLTQSGLKETIEVTFPFEDGPISTHRSDR